MRVSKDLVENIFYYTIIYFILNEWLRPVMELTDTGYFEMFSFFVVLCLALALLHVRILISWPLKLIYIFTFIVHVFGGLSLFSAEGLKYLLLELQTNSLLIGTGDFSQVTDPIRTSLFFVLIWMLVYLIHYWIAVRMTIFYFFVMTVFFIATLDTFTTYDGTLAIVKVVLLGLIMTALLFFKRLIVTTKATLNWRVYVLYMLSVVVLISFAGVFAWMLPKAGPQWADPVPFLKAATGQEGSGQVPQSGAKVGYGENDERLGGPFEADDTTVFEIEAPKRQYWRIETRDNYTSKGWTSTSFDEQKFTLDEELPFSFTGEVEPNYAFVTMYENYPFLLQPYETTGYEIAGNDIQLNLNLGSERLEAIVYSTPVPSYSYTVSYEQPEYSYTALQETSTSTEAAEKYLQLPDKLPQRVRDLALELTGNEESVYNKARAIESYFQRSGFRYETQNVPFPEENEDYVDQFLFETKYGYCDNFSTAMVVLLRAADIQARWVKGFTGGQEVGWEGDLRKYEITNNNAHSWVEVYIDGVGWVPFEPTIGYSNSVDIDYDVEDTEQDLPEQEEPEQLEPEQEQQEVAAKQDGRFVDLLIIVLLVFFVGAAIYMFFKRRKRKQPDYIVKKFSSQPVTTEQVDMLYYELLKQLAQQGLKRAPHQTLQQFAKQVDEAFETEKMSELTSIYERWVYSAQISERDILEMKESWEYLINRVGS